MSISDSQKRQNMPTVRRRAVNARRKFWSDSQKVEAVQTFLVLGNLKLVAGALKIPYETIRVWRKSEWWKQIEGDLRVQDDLQLSARLKKIVNKSYDVIEDRLEHGDFVYDQKTGTMRRKPVNMKDAHKVAIDLIDKQQELVDRHMEGTSVSSDKIEKTLRTLADNFEKIAKQITNKPVEVTDVLFGEDSSNATKES